MFKILKSKKYFILKNILRYSVVIVLGLFMFSSNAFALCPDGSNLNPCPTAGSNNTGNSTAGSDNTSIKIDTSINNPLGSVDDIPSFIKAVITAVLYIGVPIVALAIIYTGFLFVSAQGNSEKLTKAKKALLYTLIGAVLLLGAFVIANAIQSTVHEIEKSA